METPNEPGQEKPLEKRQILPAIPVLVPKVTHTETEANSKFSNEPGTLPNPAQEEINSLQQPHISEVAQESFPVVENTLEENVINTGLDDAIPSLPTLPANIDIEEEISEETEAREIPTLEEISEETPARENPTNHYPQANIEDVDGQNDSIVEAAKTANSPGDHAKENSTRTPTWMTQTHLLRR
jgi:hypothetical protein